MSGETRQKVRYRRSFGSTPFVTRTVCIGDKLWTRKPKTITNKHAFLQFHHFWQSAGDSTLTLQSLNRLASWHFNFEETRNISFFKPCWLQPTFADCFGFVQELCIEHATELEEQFFFHLVLIFSSQGKFRVVGGCVFHVTDHKNVEQLCEIYCRFDSPQTWLKKISWCRFKLKPREKLCTLPFFSDVQQ